MAIHRTKTVPKSVSDYYEREFPSKKGHSYNYYHYEGSKGDKIYGNEVYKKGKYYHNATQASEKDYGKMNKKSAKSKALKNKK